MGIETESYAQLKQRLARAEATLNALRRGEVDLVIGATEPLVVRFKTLVDEKERLFQELKRQEQALRESEARYRVISELISDYAYSFRIEADGEWTLEWVTGAFERITGYAPEEANGRRGWIDLVHPDHAPLALEHVERLLSGQDDVSEYQIVRKDGESRWLRDHAHPMWDEAQGRVLRIYGAAEDITARVQAETALREYAERLEDMVEARTGELLEAQEQLLREERLALLGQLAGAVAHELRHPLGVITNVAYYLKMKLPSPDEAFSEHLEIMEAEAKAATKIVSDLLEFGRMVQPERAQVGVSDLIDSALEGSTPGENIRVSTRTESDLSPAFVDSQQIAQVLRNLIRNACESMPEGGDLTISADEPMPQETIRIQVSDTGTGIPPENLQKIFKPLFTTKPRGIGLGLAISQKLVEANGGRIEVQSEEGKGSTFVVWLPVSIET